MAVKVYDQNALTQRMTDLYIDTIRYHSSHWQTLNGHYRSYTGSGSWVNVPDDTTFITNIYWELLNELLHLEQHRPALSATLQTISIASFITAAQTSFTV